MILSEFGLKYDYLNYHVYEEEYYETGRHFTGIGKTFLTYPSTIIIFEYSEEDSADVSFIMLIAFSVPQYRLGLQMDKQSKSRFHSFPGLSIRNRSTTSFLSK